uniref:Chromosome 15 open reading frame 39 n=1 Tax=Aquila chrysaetos chrysaetos TaxID=223781 RepID=A0A663DMU1_AQUCH
MASKRHLESLDPTIFNKLPRLETEPAAAGFPAGLCKSSPVPNPGSENHFNYKGSYFACPLQSPDGPEQPLARWSPATAYLHYGTGAGSQPVPAEGPLVSCLLYRPDGPGTGLQPPGAEKAEDGPTQEPLMVREKWSSPPPAAPLAVPKPVYRAPACFMDPRMALPLGPRAESLQQRPGDADWALPAAAPASHPLHPGEPRGSTGLRKRGPRSNPGLPNTGAPPGNPFLEASCPTAHGQRKVPEAASLSPDPWAKLQPPTAGPVYRERPPVCYPHTHYPLPLQKAALLYHPPAPTVEAQPSALPGAYKGFGFAGSGEPFPGSYFKPQAPRGYFPSPLDTYVPRAAGTGAAASPPAKSAVLPRDAEPPRRAGYVPGPGFAFGPGDVALFGTSFAGAEPGCEWHRVESPQRRAAARHDGAFQPICAPEKVPGGSGGLAEMFFKGEGGWVKPSQGEQEPPYPGRRRASPAPQETPRGGPPAPVIAGKGDACKVKDAAKELVLLSPPASPPQGLKDPRDGEVSPSSPPMPVINNVFSLAPYRDYLEGTEGSAPVPFCREHLRGDTPPQNMGGSREPSALGDVLVMSSLLPAGSVAGWGPKTGSGAVQSPGESCYRRVPEEPKLVLRDPGSREGSPDGVGGGQPAPEDVVLDLSLKRRKSGETRGPVSRAEGTPDEEEVEEEKEGPGGELGVEEGAKPQVLPLLLEVASGDKSNFQSSATFMFKKYKILRSLLPGAVPPRQAGSPCAPQPSPPPPAPPSSIPSPPPRTPPASPPASSPPAPQPAPQPSTSALQEARPDPQQPPLPEAPRAAGEENVSLSGQLEALDPQTSADQYFTTLHTWLCDVISCSVSKSSPELLQEWLKKAELIWLAFQDVAALLANLLSQLQTFMFARKCPFPHVVRAGAVFIPIHVVKKKLFPKLSGASVDQVLQEHKVELRPTTLSEEKHLRDLELKSCTSRMLKLLALKQLPDIYPDLLNLHWHNSIRQHLGRKRTHEATCQGRQPNRPPVRTGKGRSPSSPEQGPLPAATRPPRRRRPSPADLQGDARLSPAGRLRPRMGTDPARMLVPGGHRYRRDPPRTMLGVENSDRDTWSRDAPGP